MSDQHPLVSDAPWDDIFQCGEAIYERLKAKLEPAHNNEHIVIPVDTAIARCGRTFTYTDRAMRARHPADGRLFNRKIGPEPDSDSFIPAK